MFVHSSTTMNVLWDAVLPDIVLPCLAQHGPIWLEEEVEEEEVPFHLALIVHRSQIDRCCALYQASARDAGRFLATCRGVRRGHINFVGKMQEQHIAMLDVQAVHRRTAAAQSTAPTRALRHVLGARSRSRRSPPCVAGQPRTALGSSSATCSFRAMAHPCARPPRCAACLPGAWQARASHSNSHVRSMALRAFAQPRALQAALS